MSDCSTSRVFLNRHGAGLDGEKKGQVVESEKPTLDFDNLSIATAESFKAIMDKRNVPKVPEEITDL